MDHGLALWRPSEKRVQSSQMTAFTKYLTEKTGHAFSDYNELHKFSTDDSEKFWSHLMDFYQVVGEGERTPVCTDHGFDQYGWYPNFKLNFAENLLAKGKDQETALHFIHESGLQKKISYCDLKSEAARLQGSLRGLINQGDVLACFMPNIPETVTSMLATSALGGVFTSTSCDFGVEGVVDRFGQSRPKVLVTVSRYQYNGKTHSLLPKLKEISERLDFLEKIVVLDFLDSDNDLSAELKELGSDVFVSWNDFLSEESLLEFNRVPFGEPFYIMYSSGTTGKPKCIVHSVGGTLLQHIKELGLHTDLTSEKSILYFTTCGWMMWNWLVSSLAFGARVCLYEGSPGFPSLGEFFEVIKREEINIFGTSPKFLKALEDDKYINREPLEHFETLLSTGAPLLPEQYDYIYNFLKKDICVSSIAGGTDIIGCFMLGNPNLPVYRGEIQCLGLGMDVQAFDENGKGVIGKEGELVCTKSFPSRPIYFLGDETGERIKRAYFNQYPNTWHHGDFIQVTEHGGVIVYGRSDATLNPGGVRIGTAEIYRQTELLPWINDSLCVGRPVDGDVEVVLFVKLTEGKELTDDHIKEVKTVIRQNTTPRHVPRHIWAVSDIPYTRSGKKMELAVSRILAKRPLQNIEAVANPECLKEYEQYQ